jgi:hypothetical protein
MLDTTTLETLRPKATRPIHNSRIHGFALSDNSRDGLVEAETVACDYAREFDGAAFFVEVYGSQSINGKARDFAAHIMGRRPRNAARP